MMLATVLLNDLTRTRIEKCVNSWRVSDRNRDELVIVMKFGSAGPKLQICRISGFDDYPWAV